MQIAKTQQDEIQLNQLSYPESVKRYYRTLGPDALAKLTGKSRKQIIRKASELGVAKAPRASYRSSEDREKVQALVLEVHHRKDMTLAQKMAHVGASSESDYKHLARACGASRTYVDAWKPYAERINTVIEEAIETGEIPITYFKAHHTAFHDELVETPGRGSERRVKKAIERFIGYWEDEGYSIPKRGSFWGDLEVRMTSILREQERKGQTLQETLTSEHHKAFYNSLLKSKSKKAITQAFRTLNKKLSGGITGRSNRSEFWRGHLDNMIKVRRYQEVYEVGVIRALRQGFPELYKELKKTKTDAAINHAFITAYIGLDRGTALQ